MTQQQLMDNLEDQDYRREFVAEQISTGLASQIRLLRDDRQLTQEQIAKLVGTAQEMISKWENPDYGKYSLTTLKALAAAFDVALIVKFATFSEFTSWLATLSREKLAPQSYESEQLQPITGTIEVQPTVTIHLDDTSSYGVYVQGVTDPALYFQPGQIQKINTITDIAITGSTGGKRIAFAA